MSNIKQIQTRQLPDPIRHVFKFPQFNAVQSQCFSAIYENDDNFVLSAPTGSGKTVILELAICRLAAKSPNQDYKVIYQAPTKSLCSERQRDWASKFNPLGLKCVELTGDTDVDQLRHVRTADIIITTPEKWDSVTRRWKDHKKLLELVRLFLIDEVHILKEDRGASLEVVVSRMKSVGTNVRFVSLSATVPNPEDIAAWLGINNRIPGMPANTEVFDESFRPVQLQKHVYGIQAHGRNDFAFDQACNNQLPEVITRYSAQRKPIMIFCMTRKSTEVTAQKLATWWMDASHQARPWQSNSGLIQVEDQNLRKCISAGVAFHHAGLSQNDRGAVENAYLTGKLNVICCTSTLAVGVNLPCHLVIIKNTVTYQAEGCKEYSDLEVMQMLGRAGRPQFDDRAVAVIMTRMEKVERYQKMVSGQEILESRLHLNLIEHFNAEIAQGTIQDMQSAVTWLKGTFLYVRLQKNQDHYQLNTTGAKQNVEELVRKISTENIEKLQENQLIDKKKRLQTTEFGDAMARYYAHFDTMKLFLGLQPKAKISEILSALAQASEFKSIRFRSGEKSMFKNINDSPSIKFPIQVDLALGPHKISLILQAALAGIDMRHDSKFAPHSQQFQSETSVVFQHIHRLIRCIIDCQLELEDSVAVRNSLELCRSFGARAWDDSPLQMLQIDRLGPVAVRKLAGANIRSVEELEHTDAQRIDMILSRNPPFGMNIIQHIADDFPKLRISLKGVNSVKKCEKMHYAGMRVDITAEVGFLNQNPPVSFKKKPIHIVVLAELSDGKVIHFARMSAQKLGSGQDIRFVGEFHSSEQFLTCFVSCDEIAGTQKQATFKPNVKPSMFRNFKLQESQLNSPKDASETKIKTHSATSEQEESDFEDIDAEDFFTAEDNTVRDKGGAAEFRLTRPRGKDVSNDTDHGNWKTRKVEDIWQPVRLHNGNWACQHPCKDKSSCKHLCCREGLDRPPKRPKNLTASGNKTSFEPSSSKFPSLRNFVLSEGSKADSNDQRKTENHPNTSRRRSPPQSAGQTIPIKDLTDDFDGLEDIFSEIDATQGRSTNALAPAKRHGNDIFVSDTSSPEKHESAADKDAHSSAVRGARTTGTESTRDKFDYNPQGAEIRPLSKKSKTSHLPFQFSSQNEPTNSWAADEFKSSVNLQLNNTKASAAGDITQPRIFNNVESTGKADAHQTAQRVPESVADQRTHESPTINDEFDLAAEPLFGHFSLALRKVDHSSSSGSEVADTRDGYLPASKHDDSMKEWLLRQFGDIIELV